MRLKFLARAGLAALAATSLSACLGGGGGGGGAGGAAGTSLSFAPSAYSGNLDRVRGQIPTSDMRTSGSATYAGQVRVAMTPRTAGGPAGDLTGNLNLEVDFQPANSDPDTFANNVRGTAGDFTVTVNGSDVAVPGTLQAGVGGIPAVVASSQTTFDPGIPGVAPVTVRTGALSVDYAGELDFSGANGVSGTQVLLSTGGAFVGSGGTGAHGTSSLLARNPGNSASPDITGSGTFWIEQQ